MPEDCLRESEKENFFLLLSFCCFDVQDRLGGSGGKKRRRYAKVSSYLQVIIK